MGNNPMMNIDEDGEFWNLIIGAAIGGVLNWASNGAKFNAKGLGYFGVGAVAGALSAGVGTGITAAASGYSFGAGFVGSQSAMAAISSNYSSSFISGAIIGGSSGVSGGFTSGFGNALVNNQNIGQAVSAGVQKGVAGGVSGALLGGIFGAVDAYKDSRNIWTGDDVEIGRNPFSINNTPIPEDELFYIHENGGLYSIKQLKDPITSRINPRLTTNEGTYDKVIHELSLENDSSAGSKISLKIPGSHIKGYAGIKTGRYYYPKDGGIEFTSNNGLSKIINTGSTQFSFSAKRLSQIIAKIYGTGHNDGVNYGPFTFKIIVRQKK
ncbi:hypothetical protein GNY23_02295 [Labilibaculum sp. 44]|uniref:Uncharacterized protein n=1 Tax=Labilibaculum euxinus TaxID=2686357 RepID=A0A7M4D1W7_9BACT|nr:hypothetical protein [Labilibaculum euxinus]MVB05851.1 hypothetical protein [Labilibaculum euxinus]